MVIEKLKDVKRLKFQIKCIENDIEEVRNKVEHHAIKYSKIPKPSGYKDNIMEMFISRIEDLETKKNKLQMKIDMVLEELSVLPEMPYRVVYCRHVDSMSWDEISKCVGYSPAHCRRFEHEAMIFLKDERF